MRSGLGTDKTKLIKQKIYHSEGQTRPGLGRDKKGGESCRFAFFSERKLLFLSDPKYLYSTESKYFYSTESKYFYSTETEWLFSIICLEDKIKSSISI